MKQGSDIHCPDRRRFPRYPCTGAAEILQRGKSWGWGTVSDISLGGCYIETMHPLATRTELQLRLTIAGVLLEICANVISSDPMYGMGVDFIAVPTEQWNKLPQIIEKVTNVERLPAVQPSEVARPHMKAALQHLQQASEALREAMHDEEGLCAEALEFVESAINKIKTGMIKTGMEAAVHHAETFAPASGMSGIGLSSEVH